MRPPTEPVYNRIRELAELDRAWRSDRPELLIAAGRRRAGKSYLLSHFLQDRPGFYYQATRSTGREQLRTLGHIAAQRFPAAGLEFTNGFTDWDSVFRFLVRQADGKPFLLILDEVPYLLDAVRGFGSQLQRFWDHELRGTLIKVVLSGSYVSGMRRLTDIDQPLHGRKTGTLAFAPFSYRDAARFVPEWSSKDKLVAYAVFGGLPGQLALLNPSQSVAENVAQHLLNPAGRLSDEAEHLFDAFLKEAGVHYSIVRAIASGEHKWSKITNRVGKDSASLSRPLDWLQSMDVVARIIPVTDTPPGNPKKTLYRLTDPYLQFWHHFVAMIRASGADDLMEPKVLWERFVAPRLSDYMGSVFESVCRTFVGHSQHPMLPFRPVRVGEWWSDDSTDQVDLIAVGAEGEVLIGECKWGAFGVDDLATLERRRDLVVQKLSGVNRVFLAAFSGQPITDATVAIRVTRGALLHFSHDDLYDGENV